MKDKIVYWFSIFWGVVLAVFQAYKYLTNTLYKPFEIEIFVTILSGILIFKPSLFVSLISKIAKSKVNDKID